MTPLRTYKCFSAAGDLVVKAPTSLAAQERAHTELLLANPRCRIKRYQITPLLLKNADGTPYMHSTAEV